MTRSLRPYLEYQANRVEAVLVAHRTPGRITGGTVGPGLVRFFLDPAPQVRFAAIRALADDLALALKVPTLQIRRESQGVVLEFPNPQPRPVSLLALLPGLESLPPSTAVLGLTESGTPLLARLASPEVAHILIAGTTGSGKSALMRTIAASLILTHSPEALRLVCIDPKGRAFGALSGAAHQLRPPVTGISEAAEALTSLVRIMEIRDRRGETPAQGAPYVVLMIDELAELLLQGGPALADPLTRLLQRGREAGLHVVAATQRPSAAVLNGLMRANFPLRLVGRVVSADDARIASGRAGSGAHLLNGRGDFLAVSGSADPIRFQVAFVCDQELQQKIKIPASMPALTGPRREIRR